MAAGAWSIEDAIRATRARAAAVGRSRGARSTMLSTTAAPTAVEKLAQRSWLPVYVTGYNGPNQTILGGETSAVHDMAMLLQAEGYVTRSPAGPLCLPHASVSGCPTGTAHCAGYRAPRAASRAAAQQCHESLRRRTG